VVKWQTRQLEGLVGETPWRFKSSRAHHPFDLSRPSAPGYPAPMKRFLPAAILLLAAAGLLPARSAKNNVGTQIKEVDVKIIENDPSSTLGHPLILEFWATWCPPCRESIPHLNQIHAKFKDRGLVIIGITKEDKSTVKKFLKELPMHYAVALDSQGKFSGQFGIQGIPHAMMVDPSGTVVWEGHPASLKDSDIAGFLEKFPAVQAPGNASSSSTTPLPGPRPGWN
jgi:thiol-disulfide isomerase/thioredoxin